VRHQLFRGRFTDRWDWADGEVLELRRALDRTPRRGRVRCGAARAEARAATASRLASYAGRRGRVRGSAGGRPADAGAPADRLGLLPASQKAYAGLGLPVSSLTIEKVHAEPAFQGGRPVLSVTGQLRNLRDDAAEAPALRVSLLDRFGKAVATKVARPIDAAVPAHAVRYFAITLVDPPASIRDLQVTFEPPAKGAVAVAPVAGAKPAPTAGPAAK
jgi:hypothetical protein